MKKCIKILFVLVSTLGLCILFFPVLLVYIPVSFVYHCIRFVLDSLSDAIHRLKVYAYGIHPAKSAGKEGQL